MEINTREELNSAVAQLRAHSIQMCNDTSIEDVSKNFVIAKDILIAINNGQYKYICEYRYGRYNTNKESQLGYFVLANEKYLKEYYQALGYIIRIKDTGFSARVEIYWMEE